MATNDDGDGLSLEQRLATRLKPDSTSAVRKASKFNLPHTTPTRPALEAMRDHAAAMGRLLARPRPDDQHEAGARGTDGALELGSGILPTGSLELGSEDDDDFGGLIPVEDEVPSSPLSLTERHSIPRVVMPASALAKLPIDHRVGFLLSNMDGMQTLEEILDVCGCGMPVDVALELVKKLEALGAIVIE